MASLIIPAIYIYRKLVVVNFEFYAKIDCQPELVEGDLPVKIIELHQAQAEILSN